MTRGTLSLGERNLVGVVNAYGKRKRVGVTVKRNARRADSQQRPQGHTIHVKERKRSELTCVQK